MMPVTRPVKALVLFYCAGFGLINPAQAGTCDNYSPDPAISAAEQQNIQKLCSTDPSPLACIKKRSAEQLDLNYAAAIYAFLGQCKDRQHANFTKAKQQLAEADTSEAERQKALIAIKEAEALKAKAAADQKKAEDLAKNIPAAQTKSPWLVTVAVGSQYLPDYASGQTQGLSKAQAFAEIIADYRQSDIAEDDYHWGAFMQLEGVPVARKDAKQSSEIKFNDVADSLSAGVYYINMFDNKASSQLLQFLSPKTGVLNASDSKYSHYTSEWGWGGKLSFRSREKIGELNDAVDAISEIGLHYRYSEHNGQLNSGNVMPKGMLSFGVGYWDQYEDYLSLQHEIGSRWRFLMRGEYRLSEEVPAYLGFKGNLGKGPDNLSVYLSLRMKSDKILGLFTEDK